MNRYPFLAAVVVCWAVAVLDCGGESGPLLQIVRQASPTAFKGMITLQVKPIDFTNLRVGEKTEAQWLADKDPDAQASHAGDKAGMSEDFTAKITETVAERNMRVADGPGAQLVIQPRVPWLEPGYWATGWASKSAEIDIVVTISLPDGTVLDEIKTRAEGVVGFSTGERLRWAAKVAGEAVGQYIVQRASGQGGAVTGVSVEPSAVSSPPTAAQSTVGAPSSTALPPDSASPPPLASAASSPPNTAPTATGCKKDTDCKRSRICEEGVCGAPRP
jgi:hypothetical protein